MNTVLPAEVRCQLNGRTKYRRNRFFRLLFTTDFATVKCKYRSIGETVFGACDLVATPGDQGFGGFSATPEAGWIEATASTTDFAPLRVALTTSAMRPSDSSMS
jgi:hypothetical protein